MMLPLLAAAAIAFPPGIDPRHIPQGSPLGTMPIIVRPGETANVLQAPLTEKQWLAQRRAAMARAMKNPRVRAITRWVAENERKEAAREAAEAKQTADPH